MRFGTRIGTILVAVFMTACVSRRFYDMTEIQTRFTQTIQSSENILQKAQADYREKNQLLDNLNKAGNSEYQKVKPELETRLKRMKTGLESMTADRRAMDEANADIVSLAYAHPKVYSREAIYPHTDEAIGKFQKSTQDFNGDVKAFSGQSNQIADIVTEKKLFYKFDVSAFQNRIRQIIQKSQSHQKKMLKVLNDDEKVLNNWPMAETKEEQSKVFEQMRQAAQDYTEKAQGLAQISRDINDAVGGADEISTLDNNWPEASKQVNLLEQTVGDLTALNQKFKGAADLFKSRSR
jgi:hypothetical protein